jgi:hypothetical protein
MPYKTFDFPDHYTTHSWPAGDQVVFGRGWSHASEPDRPLQRMLTLKFSTLLYIKNPFTGLWLRADHTNANPANQARLDALKKRSVWCIDDFYDEHLLHEKFIYNHYVFGPMVVRFAQAFQIPAPLGGNRNVNDMIPTEAFDIRLIEQPE